MDVFKIQNNIPTKPMRTLENEKEKKEKKKY